MSTQFDYFDQIIQDIKEDIGNEASITEEVPVTEGVGLSLAKIGTKQVANKVQYPIDHEVKEMIKKKVKLEMKLKKIKRESPKNKELIEDLKDELEETEKLYKLAVSISKTDKTKDIIDQYTKKCEVEYGPRSLYYAAIKVPEIAKESARDLLVDDAMDDFYIESSMESLVFSLEDANQSDNNQSDSQNPENPPENDDSGAQSGSGNASEGTKNESNNEQKKGTVDENSIGAMLPQTGSTEGLGDPNKAISDVTKMNKDISQDELDGIELPDDIEIETALEYVMNPTYTYSYFVEGNIRNFVSNVRTKTKLSIQAKKVAMDKAILKAKLKSATRKKADRAQIDEIKKELIEKERDYRSIKSGLPAEERRELDAFFKKAEEDINKKSAKFEEPKKPNVEDNKQEKKPSEPVKENAEPFNLLYPEDELKIKLESAREKNDLYAINVYENKLKYYRLNPDKNEIVIEAANIDAEIKPVIEVLNNKGYKTKYSSAGHVHLRKKEDGKRDGVYHDKLYSDARIMFDDDFKFPAAPKYWCWKIVDGKDYLDIIPERYNPKNGTPDEAFAKWKANYMSTLRTWVDNLPDRKNTGDDVVTKDRKGRDIVIESVEEINDDLNFLVECMSDDTFDDVVFEKKTRNEYAIEKFKKKYQFKPSEPGSRTGTIVVDGETYDVNLDSDLCATDGDTVYLNKNFFRLKNGKRRDAILQHEIGHSKLHTYNSYDGLNKGGKHIDETLKTKKALEQHVKSTVDNAQIKTAILGKKAVEDGIRNDEIFKKHAASTNNSPKRDAVLDAANKYHHDGTPHENTQEVEADAYSASRVSASQMKRGLRDTYKQAKKEFKKPKYKEHIDMKQFMKSASSDYNNRSKALKDRDLQMKANQAFGPNASKSDNDNDKNVQNKNDNADNKKPTHDDNKHEDAE